MMYGFLNLSDKYGIGLLELDDSICTVILAVNSIP